MSELVHDGVWTVVSEQLGDVGLSEVYGAFEELSHGRGGFGGGLDARREASDVRELEGKYGDGGGIGKEFGNVGYVAGGGEKGDANARECCELARKLDEGVDMAEGEPGVEHEMEVFVGRVRHFVEQGVWVVVGSDGWGFPSNTWFALWDGIYI